MKTFINYIYETKNKFIIRGHSKNQNNIVIQEAINKLAEVIKGKLIKDDFHKCQKNFDGPTTLYVWKYCLLDKNYNSFIDYIKTLNINIKTDRYWTYIIFGENTKIYTLKTESRNRGIRYEFYISQDIYNTLDK